MIQPGKHTVKVWGARFIASSKGTNGLEVAFKRADGESIRWVGWLSDAAYQRTYATMADVLGFSIHDYVVGDNGIVTKGLDTTRDVEIVVENETNPTDGKAYPRVKWVNAPGGGSGFQACTPQVVKGEIHRLLKTAHAIHEADVPSVNVAKPAAKAPIADEEVPF